MSNNNDEGGATADEWGGADPFRSGRGLNQEEAEKITEQLATGQEEREEILARHRELDDKITEGILAEQVVQRFANAILQAQNGQSVDTNRIEAIENSVDELQNDVSEIKENNPANVLYRSVVVLGAGLTIFGAILSFIAGVPVVGVVFLGALIFFYYAIRYGVE